MSQIPFVLYWGPKQTQGEEGAYHMYFADPEQACSEATVAGREHPSPLQIPLGAILQFDLLETVWNPDGKVEWRRFIPNSERLRFVRYTMMDNQLGLMLPNVKKNLVSSFPDVKVRRVEEQEIPGFFLPFRTSQAGSNFGVSYGYGIVIQQSDDIVAEESPQEALSLGEVSHEV